MESESLSKHVQVILERVAKENDFQNPRFEVKGGSDQGDNFVGQIKRITVFESDDNAKEALNLIIKLAPQNARRRELYRTKTYFKTEVYMYDVVFPALKRLLTAKRAVLESQVAFPATARVYATHLSDDGSEDTIIMEDMGSHGFVMGDRFLGADAEQCRIVIRQLARLHAASIVLKEENPEVHNRLVDSLEEAPWLAEFEVLFKVFANNIRPMISARFPEGTEGRAKYEAFATNLYETMRDLIQRNDQLSVICHGDMWLNNALFKYEKESALPTDACFIDFQLSRYCSPVCDLSYFLFTSTTKTVRDQHLKQLLQDYHRFLRTFLESFGYPSDKIVTWDTMEEQFRKYMKFGLGMAIMGIPVIMSKPGDLRGVDEDVEEHTSLEDTFTVIGDNPARDERISDVLQDLVELGYL